MALLAEKPTLAVVSSAFAPGGNAEPTGSDQGFLFMIDPETVDTFVALGAIPTTGKDFRRDVLGERPKSAESA